MSSFFVRSLQLCNSGLCSMGFIKIEETQDTLWVKTGLKRVKRNVIFMAGWRKTFELAAKEIFANMKSLSPSGNFLFHKYFSGCWPSMLCMGVWVCLQCTIRQFFKEIKKLNNPFHSAVQFGNQGYTRGYSWSKESPGRTTACCWTVYVRGDFSQNLRGKNWVKIDAIFVLPES